jgi:FAD/FMN-containing dehydrogenase
LSLGETLTDVVQQYDENSKDIIGENYDRLARIKAEYDPNNMFDKLFAIAPVMAAEPHA